MILSRPDRAAAWLREARAAGWHRLPPEHPCAVARVALDQRANLEAVRAGALARGTAPGWCDLEEYEEAVALLERAAARALGGR